MPIPRQRIIQLAKLIILALVGWGIYGTVQSARRDLASSPLSWSDLRWSWIGAATLAYALGLLPMALFWHHLLHQMHQQPVGFHSFRAHIIGHLGKYVPGKALVIVLRASLIAGPNTNTTVAAVASLIESLMMMASGGFVAAIIFLIAFPKEQLLQLLAVGLMVVTGLPIIPSITRRLVRSIGSEKWRTQDASEQLDNALSQLTARTFAFGSILYLVTWLLWGISLGATVVAIADTVSPHVIIDDLARFVASVALALVVGFISLLPGGVFAREWVFGQMLTPQYGAAIALVAAVAVRVIWMVTEVVLSVILYLCKTRP